MRMVNGGEVRTTTGLNLRVAAGTNHSSVAVLGKDVILHVLDVPHDGWVEVALMGWVSDADPATVYCEPDARSSLKTASRSLLKSAFVTEIRREGAWRELRIVGFVSTGFLVVVDGPK
ncbi:MAG: SH3 domain-containing protein [Caldilinea sp.]|nr:SH3 domain-containing protein [Caldilinea sp.]